MKKIFFIAIIVAGIATTYSCKKINELARFSMNYSTEFTVPAGTPVNLPLDIPTPGIETNFEETFKNNNTNAGLIDEITLSSLTITVKAPQGATLDFLKSVEFFIKADGLDEVKLASSENIADGLTSLDLTATGVNLKDYLTKNTIKLRVKTVTDKVLAENRELEAKFTFQVQAKIV